MAARQRRAQEAARTLFTTVGTRHSGGEASATVASASSLAWAAQHESPPRPAGRILVRYRTRMIHILHVRCQFCVIRTVRRNLQFLAVWVSLRKKSIVQRDGLAQKRAQAKLERKRRWLKGKYRPFSFGGRTHPFGRRTHSLHTSTYSRSSDHERGEHVHTTKRLWSGRGPGQARSNVRRSKALRWSVRLSSVDISFCSGRDSTDIVKTSLLACSWR